MTDPQERPDVATLTYEQARDELIQVVNALEQGAASLEDSLALWERGEALADRCQSWLDAAKERLAAASAERTAATDDAAPGATQPNGEDGDERAGTGRQPVADDDGPPW